MISNKIESSDKSRDDAETHHPSVVLENASQTLNCSPEETGEERQERRDRRGETQTETGEERQERRDRRGETQTLVVALTYMS